MVKGHTANVALADKAAALLADSLVKQHCYESPTLKEKAKNSTVKKSTRHSKDPPGKFCIDSVISGFARRLKDAESLVGMGMRFEAEEVREEVGVAEVKAVFGSGKGKVAGCYVSDGKLLKNCLVSVSRGGEVVYEGPLSSLRREKDKVDEVPMGMECGVGSDWSKW